MTKVYDHKKIEKKWQSFWAKKGIYKASVASKKKKFYGLIEFPYPSGAGLHVGHIRSNTAMDIISRKRRMEGYNVLYPIGWDAFGLPTENYAIKTGIHPIKVTKQNTDIFRKQLKSLGFGFDWAREVNTTDPKYYKWTQWIFLQFFKKGLAYKTKTEINWCPSCKIGLANEEVVGGMCERCSGPTEKREKEQWMLAITKYAERLDKDLDTVDFLPKIKIQQRNWIGKSEGINITYQVEGLKETITVFTTRPDTNFGATFIALAPDGEFVKKNLKNFKNQKKVQEYINEVGKKTDIERLAEGKKKTGVFTGLYAVNGLNNKKMPMYVADFVLGGVGTGALVGVPGHDVRDFEFAKEMSLEIIRVVVGNDGDRSAIVSKEQVQEEAGIMINSGFLDGMDIHHATKKIMDHMEKLGMGQRTITYKLRDWVFSRQRYWGEPIPLIFCENCYKKETCQPTCQPGRLTSLNAGWVPVPDKDLPVVLPKVTKYKPTDTGESPLATMKSWVNTKCPKCKGKARRETDTMPNWAGSSWYYLRYADDKNKKEFASKKNLNYWMPVDWYNGGMEHTTLHLLYSRFWHKFLYDLELVPTSEPYAKRTSHGMILADDGTKFSKSKGNGIDPEDLVKRYGADTVRLYEMFMGPFDQSVAWNSDSLIGPRRFLERVWKLSFQIQPQKKNSSTFLHPAGGTFHHQNSSSVAVTKLLHKTIKKVTEDIENMRFNTAISSMMVFLNEAEKSEIGKDDFKKFLQILAPFAPHMAEELWQNLYPYLKFGSHPKLAPYSRGRSKEGVQTDSIHLSEWPKYDKNLIKDDELKIAVQVNGKVRGEVVVPAGAMEEEIKASALADTTVQRHISGQEVKKIIYVKGRLINIVV